MRAPISRLFAATLLLAGAGTAAAQAPPPVAPSPAPTAPAMSDADVVAALKAHLDALARDDAFSGAVLLAKGSTPLFRAAYGLASRSSGVANRPDTRFNLGSINKAFTRLAIEQLAAAGKLALTDTLDRYVPEYPPEKGRKITIAHLLAHRGGTGDFFGPKYTEYDKSRLRDLRDWLPLIKDEPLHFEPGTRQEYSNAGYLLLGMVIEKVSGRSYYDHVREQIFAPAGMSDTDSYPNDDDADNRATGYTRALGGSDTWAENGRALPWRGSSAGGGYSTVDDLLRFAQALRTGRFGLPGVKGGLGVAGGAPGVNAALELTGDYTAVVLANLDPPTAERIAAQIRGWLGGSGAAEAGPRRRVTRGGPDDAPRKPRSSSLPEDGVDVPMLRSGHVPAVQVRVNGQGPFLFGIDTGGAGMARIDAALAARLGLAKVGEVQAGDSSGKNVQTLALVAVDSIEIGGARFAGLTAAVRDLNVHRREKVDGVLGFELFADCLLTLDYPANRVRLRGGELPLENGREVLSYRDGRGVPSVTLRVAGRPMEADVDAGAMGGITLPESEAAHLPLASAPRVVGRARTISSTFEVKAAALDGDVVIGGFTLSKPTIEFQPVFPMANLGARVLRDFAVTFDQKNRRLRLSKPGDP